MDTARIAAVTDALDREAALADQRAMWARMLEQTGWQQARQQTQQFCVLGLMAALAQGQPVRKPSRWWRVRHAVRHGFHDWLHRNCRDEW